MLVETVYGGYECVGLEFENNVFLFNPTENFNCRFRVYKKRIFLFQTLPNIIIRSYKSAVLFTPSQMKKDFKININLEKNLEVSFYPNRESFAVLIKRGKFRFLYMDSNYITNVGHQLISDIVSDLKKFFVRRIDIAYLPLISSNDKILKELLIDLKPKRLAPLLPTNEIFLIEDFVKNNIFEKTAVLIYDRECDRFKFNLI